MVIIISNINILLITVYKFILLENHSNILSFLISRNFSIKKPVTTVAQSMTFESHLKPEDYSLSSITPITIYKIINPVYY